jgi:uncharacterized membrane protein YkvI
MPSTRFQRLVLPGLAFKAVVIGGGYATGREMVQFFFPSGPAGGMAGLFLTMALWSAICALSFLFARVVGARNYRDFFASLLGPGWIVFEVAYVLLVLLVLSVFGAAAGEIFASVFGLPRLAGALALTAGIALVVTFGDSSVERIFKYVSFLLYGVYLIFVVLAFARFGDRIGAHLQAEPIRPGWLMGGLTYAGYNLVGAVVILPVARHFTSNRDAVVAGLICGPLAALPAILFFLCMVAFYPEVGAQALPSNFLLERLGVPAFRYAFEAMVLAALLESGSALVHSVNARVMGVLPGVVGRRSEAIRLGSAMLILVASIFVASRFGLIELIAKGYSASAYVFLAIFVLPLVTVGVWRIVRSRTVAAPLEALP